MDNPLSNLKDLSKPLTKLVSAISKGIGTLYSPFGTVRQAEADARAKIIHAEADAQVQSIQDRAKNRLMYREALRQENIERISCIAANELPEKVSDDDIDDDWIIQFFDHAQDVCDSDLQTLWARILAGEVTSPGKYSKRTLQFLKTLDKDEAEKFTQLCSVAIQSNEGCDYILHSKATTDAIRNQLGEGGWMEHFKSIGLLSPTEHLPAPSDFNGAKITYHGTHYLIEGPEKAETQTISTMELPVSLTMFSVIGQQLAGIAGAEPIDDYIESLASSLQAEDANLRFTITSEENDS